jgi:hypothetical protein
LKLGMFVGLGVVEGEPVAPRDSPPVVFSFPWTPPAVSTQGVLSATRECHTTGVSTLPLAVYLFEAVSTGKVIVTIPLAKA